MKSNGPYIWCLSTKDLIIPLGNGKSLEYARELGKESYAKSDEIKDRIKLFKLVEVLETGKG